MYILLYHNIIWYCIIYYSIDCYRVLLTLGPVPLNVELGADRRIRAPPRARVVIMIIIIITIMKIIILVVITTIWIIIIITPRPPGNGQVGPRAGVRDDRHLPVLGLEACLCLWFIWCYLIVLLLFCCICRIRCFLCWFCVRPRSRGATGRASRRPRGPPTREARPPRIWAARSRSSPASHSRPWAISMYACIYIYIYIYIYAHTHVFMCK